MCVRYLGNRGLKVRKTAVSPGSTELVTYREIVAKEAIAAAELKFYCASRERSAAYGYRNGL
jgi:hypothetical protein